MTKEVGLLWQPKLTATMSHLYFRERERDTHTHKHTHTSRDREQHAKEEHPESA